MIIAKVRRRCMVRLVGQEVTRACKLKARSDAFVIVGEVRLCLFGLVPRDTEQFRV